MEVILDAFKQTRKSLGFPTRALFPRLSNKTTSTLLDKSE